MNWNWILRRILLGPLLRIFFWVRVVGRENLPKEGPFILVFGPHMSELESALIATYLGHYELHFFAKDSYWKKGKGYAWFMDATGQIPISQSGGDAVLEQMEKGVAYAKRGKITAWYPEGTRGADGVVHKGHTGAARVAVKAGGIPIVPVGLRGMGKFNRPGRWIRPGRGKMVVGKAIYPLRHAPRDKTNLTEKAFEGMIARYVTDMMMKEIARLADTSYDPTYSPIGAAGKKTSRRRWFHRSEK